MPLRIHLHRQVVSPNTKGVASFSPGLPFTATPETGIIQIMNSNGVPAWVGGGWNWGYADAQVICEKAAGILPGALCRHLHHFHHSS